MAEEPLPPLAIGIGEVLWDLLPSGRQLGGAPGNFAYHARALGARAAVVSAVGEDELGGEVVGRLRGLGVGTEYVAVVPGRETGTVSVTLDGAGVPSYEIRTGVAWDFIPDSGRLRELAGRADVICFGSLAQRSPVSRGTIMGFLRAAGAGALRVFDINLRQAYYDEGVIRGSLEVAGVLKINDEELPRVAGVLELGAGEEGVIGRLFEGFGALEVVALTRGGRGSSLYRRAGEVSHHPGFKAEVVDTVGAGDAFTAAMAMGMLKGWELGRINEMANRVAAYVCSRAGATPVMPGELVGEQGGG